MFGAVESPLSPSEVVLGVAREKPELRAGRSGTNVTAVDLLSPVPSATERCKPAVLHVGCLCLSGRYFGNVISHELRQGTMFLLLLERYEPYIP